MVKKDKENSDLKTAPEGIGPLLQRDYWAVIKSTSYLPQEIATLMREKFFIFPPDDLVIFKNQNQQKEKLEVGDRLKVNIKMKKPVSVQVIHLSAATITLGTGKEHPEAGRITFGSYRNRRQDVIFHIRSRARQGSILDFVEFKMIGDAMQTNTWTDYIDRIAHILGEGVIGSIHAKKQKVEPREEDKAMNAPTFIATKD